MKLMLSESIFHALSNKPESLQNINFEEKSAKCKTHKKRKKNKTMSTKTQKILKNTKNTNYEKKNDTEMTEKSFGLI